MASSGNRTELIVIQSRRVRQYSLPPWAPQSEEHRTIRERSEGNLVKTCNGSSDSTQLYTDVIRISMILRCTLVQ